MLRADPVEGVARRQHALDRELLLIRILAKLDQRGLGDVLHVRVGILLGLG